MRRVRSVVRGDAIDSAVRESGEQGFAIFTRAQRGIHFVIGIVLAHVLIQQREVVWRDFTGHAQVIALGFADGPERSGS